MLRENVSILVGFISGMLVAVLIKTTITFIYPTLSSPNHYLLAVYIAISLLMGVGIGLLTHAGLTRFINHELGKRILNLLSKEDRKNG